VTEWPSATTVIAGVLLSTSTATITTAIAIPRPTLALRNDNTYAETFAADRTTLATS